MICILLLFSSGQNLAEVINPQFQGVFLTVWLERLGRGLELMETREAPGAGVLQEVSRDQLVGAYQQAILSIGGKRE